MSSVSSLLLQASTQEEVFGRPQLVSVLNEWLGSRKPASSRGWLRMEQHVGGWKAAEVLILGLAHSYPLMNGELIEHLMTYPWKIPGDVVLVVHSPHGGTTIYRPSEYVRDDCSCRDSSGEP